MSYFYGPVPSRRLGFSLGVDLVPKKSCSFNCVYCQLGKTTHKTIRRFSYINLKKLESELRGILKKKPKIDYITISGSGEPTLHKNIDKIIAAIKKVTKKKIPVCVITNSSLLYRASVRKQLRNADLIIPSLDAACAKTFQKINRPHKSITFKKIVNGLVKLREEFKGKIWLEIMLVKGINDNVGEAKKFKCLVDKIKPDKVQLNLPVRPSSYKISPPLPKAVSRIKKIIDNKAEVTRPSNKNRQQKFYKEVDRQLLSYLRRRPANLEDLVVSLGLNSNELIKHLSTLLKKKKIKRFTHQKNKYFIAND